MQALACKCGALSFLRGKKLSISPLDRPHEVCYNIKLLRGISAVGSAPQWHCGGQGFDSLMLHSPQNPNLFLQKVRIFYFEMNRAHAHSRAAACTDSSAERHANAASPPIAFVRGSNARGEWRRFRLLGALPRALCRFTDRRRPSPSRPRARQPKYPFAAKTHGEWQR